MLGSLVLGWLLLQSTVGITSVKIASAEKESVQLDGVKPTNVELARDRLAVKLASDVVKSWLLLDWHKLG